MTSTVNAPDSRVNVVIRLVGIMVFGLGAAMTYETFVEAAAATLVPQLVPVLYLCSTMLMLAGLLAAVSKYRMSGAPKT
jgi:hypothetical protein